MSLKVDDLTIDFSCLIKETTQLIASLDKASSGQITCLYQKVIDAVLLLKGEEQLLSISNHRTIQPLEEIRQHLEAVASSKGIQLPATLNTTLSNTNARIARCILNIPPPTSPTSHIHG